MMMARDVSVEPAPANPAGPHLSAVTAIRPGPEPSSLRCALAGWGRYPIEECDVFRPERRRELTHVLGSTACHFYIARGLGRSYGDAALNRDHGVISCVRLNRLLSFDESTGRLQCEAGVRFDELIATFLPRGFFLPVTPGTKFVTVGGAIASDVHGKNHHCDGSLASFVESFVLVTVSGAMLHCSRSANTELFWATLGGMGLTGVILCATLCLKPVSSAYVTVDYVRAKCLEEVLDVTLECDDRYQYSVAWMDCMAGGPSMGRGILMRANETAAVELPSQILHPLQLPGRRKIAVPVALPSVALNRYSAALFNDVYYAFHRTRREIVDFDSFFYPLDAVEKWNLCYGRRGFIQYQVVFPMESARKGLLTLMKRVSSAGAASFLAVLKAFGEGNSGYLSFPRKGFTLALDMPVTPFVRSFVDELDHLVLEHGGRVYLAKDALLQARTFRMMYPRFQEFQEIRAQVDPAGKLSSSLARRLDIC